MGNLVFSSFLTLFWPLGATSSTLYTLPTLIMMIPGKVKATLDPQESLRPLRLSDGLHKGRVPGADPHGQLGRAERGLAAA